MTLEELAHNKRVEALALKVRLIYAQAAREAARFATLPNYDPNKPFSVENYPNTKRGFDKMMRELFEQTKSTITEGIDKEWYEVNKNLDKLARSRRPDPPKEWMQHNEKAREAFKARKESGMDLSTRVWNLSEQFKQEMELAIDVALTDGRSAAELSRDIRQYLNEPDKLFRRVRNKETGKLQLSKAAKAYHPGRGVYRSSYKNAMRLARTETNMAYRNADHERFQQLDFVIGFEVHLSNNHPVSDICDYLKGKYPKGFKYSGWHPHCRCYVTTIMMDDKEFNEVEDKLLAGEDISGYQSPNAITTFPKGMADWVKINAPRAQNWANMPYFVRDNFIDGRIEKGLDKKRFTTKAKPAKAAKTEIDGRTIHLEEVVEMPKKKEVVSGLLDKEAFDEIQNRLVGNNYETSFGYNDRRWLYDREVSQGKVKLPPYLTSDEGYAIYEYTSASYGKINNFFNKGMYQEHAQAISDWDKLIKHTLEKIRINEPQGTVQLYKGSRIANETITEIQKALKENKTWANKGLFSTSREIDVAKDFQSVSTAERKKVMFYIESNRAADISKLTSLNEKEALYGTSYEWKIKDVIFNEADNSYSIFISDL